MVDRRPAEIWIKTKRRKERVGQERRQEERESVYMLNQYERKKERQCRVVGMTVYCDM